MKDVNVVTMLQATKDWLMENGWVQKSFREENGACILGAMNRAAWVEDYGYRDKMIWWDVKNNVVELICEVIEDHKEEDFNGTIMSWNDEEGRTFNEVIDVIDEAIIRSKERG